jgi:eukaryotic-like serine/threonine-protein kinase
MGEVYRARDTRLDRIVAVKILPGHLADRSELRERFEREAKTIASLNHPHICTLYDIGHQDGTDFLVMEYLEGETLAQHLLKGPLPLDQVLQYAIEIADALDKAHRKGVTHRDLKPGNIMLTKSGTKLLDFGLAKLKQEVAPANVQLSQLPTANDPLTAQGTIVGTLQYMAPEQLEGKEVDARTDIFAFGVVVYEMATGKRAFEGKSQASLIAAILEREPPAMSSLQPMTPPQLNRVVKKCLAKEPEGRWQAASDLTDALKWIAEGGSQAALPVTAARGFGALGRRAALLMLAGVVLGGIIASLAAWKLKSPVPPGGPPIARLAVVLSSGLQIAGLNFPAVALSPNGTQLAYVAAKGSTQQLYLRALDSLDAKPIPGTDGASAPFFSPDGQWIGFFAQGKLRKVSATGGSLQTLSDAPYGEGGSWGPDDTIYFAPSNISGLWKVAASGGKAQEVTKLDRNKGEFSHRWPQVLPGGKAVLFTFWTGPGWEEGNIAVQLLATGERRVLVKGGNTGRYVPTGHLVYSRAGALMAVPFDLTRLEVSDGPPTLLGEIVSEWAEGAHYTLSVSGSLAYVPDSPQRLEHRLAWVDRKGSVEPLPTPPRPYENPRISPDGRRVAVQIEEATIGIWVYDLSRATLTRLTTPDASSQAPLWTPDGKHIAYRATRAGFRNLFWNATDGTGTEERLTAGESIQTPSSWSPDGKLLAFTDQNPTTGINISVLPLEGDRKPQLFLRTKTNLFSPAFSPDARWLAYMSNESGRNEVYVQPFPGPGGKSQISTEGGREPVWARNGRELFYRNGDKMMAVDITTQPTFTVGSPRLLFEGRYETSPNFISGYDVSSDGQRFLMIQPVEPEQPATQINVVLNWFEELKQKVPVGKK